MNEEPPPPPKEVQGPEKRQKQRENRDKAILLSLWGGICPWCDNVCKILRCEFGSSHCKCSKCDFHTIVLNEDDNCSDVKCNLH